MIQQPLHASPGQEQGAQGALCSCPPLIDSVEEFCPRCREEYEDWMRAFGPHPILEEPEGDQEE